eukprot:scaffold12299_cov277-Chaetoceros_neogracile.AAC.2
MPRIPLPMATHAKCPPRTTKLLCIAMDMGTPIPAKAYKFNSTHCATRPVMKYAVTRRNMLADDVILALGTSGFERKEGMFQGAFEWEVDAMA